MVFSLPCTVDSGGKVHVVETRYSDPSRFGVQTRERDEDLRSEAKIASCSSPRHLSSLNTKRHCVQVTTKHQMSHNEDSHIF